MLVFIIFQTNCSIIDFDPPLTALSPEDEELDRKYPPPHQSQSGKFELSPATKSEVLTRDNYRERMHDLLKLEELAQNSNSSRYNVKTVLTLVKKYLITSNTNSSTAKYSRPGEKSQSAC